MNQRPVVIVFLIIAALGLGVAGVSFLQGTIKSNITTVPTPTPQGLQLKDQESTGQAVKGTQISMTPQQPKQYRQFPGVLSFPELQNKKAVIVTDKGKIEFEIYPEATKAASNFIFLTRDGFYNGLRFHRVEPGFVIQGGDPLGNGTGGPGYQFPDEPVTKKYNKGIVAMANSGPDTNGSQFFIMLEDNPGLPPKYTIFGQVTLGQSVVDQIKAGDIMRQVTIEPR